ncbi:FadR/GntR family transcriptional regulator [Nonomuraea antimicrobica]|uniref:FadR/GntR family transcriptional regulator n=1 Tax=Nonomuraea antimicrobica TaxID=561173 RepID=A0ABP7D2Q2_9ACTN
MTAGIDRRSASGADTGRDGIRRISTTSVADRVAGELLRLISTDQLSPGDKLPSEPDLARQLGVGRSTVREAKQMLISRGFLESRGKVGTFVADQESRRVPLEMLDVLLTMRRVEELHQARNILEVGAIRLACELATEAELAALDAHLDRLSQVDGDEEFWSGTVAFHSEIVRACHNTAIIYMFNSLSDAMRTDQLPIHARANVRADGVERHRRLLRALRTRDPNAAAAEMADHLAQSHHHDLSVLGTDRTD